MQARCFRPQAQDRRQHHEPAQPNAAAQQMQGVIDDAQDGKARRACSSGVAGDRHQNKRQTGKKQDEPLPPQDHHRHGQGQENKPHRQNPAEQGLAQRQA